MDENEPKYERKSVNIEDFHRFTIKESSYDKQFSNIYIARLKALRKAVEDKAKLKWGNFHNENI